MSAAADRPLRDVRSVARRAGRRRRAPGVLVIVNWRDRRHPEAGGAEVVCEQLARSFAERGERVVVLTAASAPNPSTEERDGYRIVRRGSRLGVYPAALWWLMQHRREIDAVIDSQNGIPFFAPLALPTKTPVVLLIHHVHQEQFDSYFSPLAARLARFLESRVTSWVYGDRVIACVSPSTRRDVRVRLGLRGQGRVIAPGAPPARPRPAGAGRSAHPRVVCVGRLVPHKRTELIVAAMAEVITAVPDAQLHLIGDGPEREQLARLVAERGLAASVTVHGALPSAERDELLETAWLTVSASQREGWGLSILEANAFGVPAVAFRRPGLRDSIRSGETGWLVDNEHELAAAVADALGRLKDPDVNARVRAACHSWVGQFSWDTMTDRFAATIAGEAQRLAVSPDDRRLATDLACVVDVPRAIVPDGWVPQLRLGDQLAFHDEHVTLLFHGADTDSARVALARIGLGPVVAAHDDVHVRVARPTDLLALPAPSPREKDGHAAMTPLVALNGSRR